MRIRALTNNIAVGTQIGPGDVAALAARGFLSLVCVRPDGEEAGQPEFELVEYAAVWLGLHAHFFPVRNEEVEDEHVRGFG